MTDYQLHVITESWTLTADSTNPYDPATDPNPHRWLLDGWKAGWAVDTLPPVAAPATCQFQVYDDGQHVDGWLPIEMGQAVRVLLIVTEPLTLETYAVVPLDGRVADLEAANSARGGVIYSVVVTDRLGTELAADNAPRTIQTAGGGSPDTKLVRAAYDQLMGWDATDQLVDEDEIRLHLEYLAPSGAGGFTHPAVADARSRAYDASGSSVLDLLNLYVAHDIRTKIFGTWKVAFWVQQVPSNASDALAVPPPVTKTVLPTGETIPAHEEGSTGYDVVMPGGVTYQLVEYDPRGTFALDQLNVMRWTGTDWQPQYDPNYYDVALGMVLYARQLLLDVGAWRQRRNEALNRWELTGDFERDAGANTQTVRRSWGDLVRQYGVNSRSLPSPCWYRDEGIAGYGAVEVLDVLRGDQSQVQSGYGFEAATIVWDQLDNQQMFAWAAHLWPVDYRQAYARPLAIVDIPDQWRLADGEQVFGRLMGCEFELKRGELLAHMQVRQVPPTTYGGITLDEMGDELLGSWAPNATFAIDLRDWESTSADDIATYDTTEGYHETTSALLTAGATGNATFETDNLVTPVQPGDHWSCGVRVKAAAGTPRQARIDLRWRDSAGIAFQAVLGAAVLTSSSAWTAITSLAGVAPAGAAYVTVRVVYLSPAAGDAVRIDAVRLNPGDTLPTPPTLDDLGPMTYDALSITRLI